MISRLRLGRLIPALLISAVLSTQITGVAAAAPKDATLLAGARTAILAGDSRLALADLNEVAPRIPAVAAIETLVQEGMRNSAAQRVAALMAAVASQPRHPGAGSVEAGVRSVYASSPLRDLGHRSGSRPSLTADLGNLLLGLLHDIYRLGGNLTWIIGAVVLLLLGGALTVLALRRSKGEAAPDETLLADLGQGPGRRPESLFAQAELLQAGGDFREAVRLAFQALLLSATARRVLTVDPAWTNTELLRAALRVADLEPRLRPLVSQFNAVVYGGRDPGPDGCSQFTRACRAAAGTIHP